MCLDKCVCVCDISWEFAELGVFNPILETIFNYFSAIFSFLLWESKYMHVSLIAWYCPTGHRGWIFFPIFFFFFGLWASFWVIYFDFFQIHEYSVSSLLFFLFNDLKNFLDMELFQY